MAFVGSVGVRSAWSHTQTAHASLCRAHAQKASAFLGAAPRVQSMRVRATRRQHAQPQMNLFDRFFRVVRSVLNRVVGNFEDPEKIIIQTMTDMQNDLVKVRQVYAQVAAAAKRTERELDQSQSISDGWKRRAEIALRSGDELLAREALIRKNQADIKVKTVRAQLETLNKNIQNLQGSIMEIESKMSEAQNMKHELIARAQAAKTTTRINSMLNSVSDSSGLAAFERMREKVETLEAESEVTRAASLSATPSIEARFRELEGASSVDEELRRMKEEMNPKMISMGTLDSQRDLDLIRLQVKRDSF
ncbi:putative membrane-associated 30 kDa protein, chloroplastic [Porphyridium purpureum]|uniref:Putative membrane-associated 30 kDa protein, chloroplastic n=1 Tax=Porphyridium purpureum TaxID=35688 RepID=A0A5J4YTI5_PORPP|nr:putative membrane-associated 30 kDa protein, chloroplastic [Porphyridium purpureum]|eukprot:POR2667..scf229_5